MDLQKEQLLLQQADIGGYTGSDGDLLLNNEPSWNGFKSACRSFFAECRGLSIEAIIQVIKKDVKAAQSSIQEVLMSDDASCVSHVVLFLYEVLRFDSSLYDVVLGVPHHYESLRKHLSRKPSVADVDRTLYILGGVMSHSGTREYSDDQVREVIATDKASPIGMLAFIANLLKSNEFREVLWKSDVVELVFRFKATSPAPILYKSLLCVWLWSFNERVVSELHDRNLIERLNAVLSSSRVEKIVRIVLQILKNTLVDPQICEDVAEKGSLEIVNQLEYEKWRDAELYEDIKSCSSKIAQQISVLSNFDRYERELHTGKLSWGFIHSERFWAENVKKFEKDDFRAVKTLCGLISQKTSSAETLAVTCHDLGEFARLHPIGKRICDRFAVKGRVLELMLDKDREVSREALLCVQKLMLQKQHTMD